MHMHILNFSLVAYVQNWRRHKGSTYNYFLKRNQKNFRGIKAYNHDVFEWEETLAVPAVLTFHPFL